MRIIKSIIIVILVTSALKAQLIQNTGFSISNNVMSMPGKGYPKLFYSAFHPGIDIYAKRQVNKKVKNQFWLQLEAGFFYHRYIQTAVKLCPTFQYRYCFSPKFYAEIGTGFGYLHSFTSYSIFKLNSNGDYEKISYWKGRAQFVQANLLGAGIKIKNNLNFTLQLRTFAQGIFSRSFAPLMIYNSFSVGLEYILKS